MAERSSNNRGSGDRNRANSGGSRGSSGRSSSPRSSSGRSNPDRPSSGRPSSSRSSNSRPSFGRPTSRPDSRRDEFGSDSRRDSRSDSRRNDERSDRRPSSGRPSSARPSSSRPSSRTDSRREDRRDDRTDSRRGDERSERRPSSGRPSSARPSSRNESRSDSRRPDSRGDDSRRDSNRPRTSSSRPARLPSSKTGFDNNPRRGTSAGAPVGMAKERGGVRNREVSKEDFIEVSNDIDTKLLPKQVLAELRNISPKAADYVGKHLAAAMMALEDDDADRAYQHAIAARSQGSRLASVREMCGLAAYYNEKWSEALNEFRTYQRITGDPHFMPLMADCERGLGRPEKALNLAKSDQVRSLDADTRIEFRIVISGARADLKQFEAALATLECPELHSKKQSPAITRLRYAYANALQQLNRLDEARDWFVKTSLSDSEDITDAAERAVLISEM